MSIKHIEERVLLVLRLYDKVDANKVLLIIIIMLQLNLFSFILVDS